MHFLDLVQKCRAKAAGEHSHIWWRVQGPAGVGLDDIYNPMWVTRLRDPSSIRSRTWLVEKNVNLTVTFNFCFFPKCQEEYLGQLILNIIHRKDMIMCALRPMCLSVHMHACILQPLRRKHSTFHPPPQSSKGKAKTVQTERVMGEKGQDCCCNLTQCRELEVSMDFSGRKSIVKH